MDWNFNKQKFNRLLKPILNMIEFNIEIYIYIFENVDILNKINNIKFKK